ncbi:MAG: anhydro-N-acetylmuramic acid kinase, partial [Kiloniellales bacterium]|nr:anhydro-N-acetylmuramic acid kinase [Kiloniellales bacterium]
MTTSYWALGLMSGTSMDGIDSALLRSDGTQILELGPAMTLSYDTAFKQRLRAALGSEGQLDKLECDLTQLHAEAVRLLLGKARMAAADVYCVGFHGQTICHAPERRFTRQLGDGSLLAHETGIDVVSDFRSLDVREGGEGAPLAPLYHRALAQDLERPLAVLNLGGVSNVTGLGESEGEILAFDCGP